MENIHSRRTRLGRWLKIWKEMCSQWNQKFASIKTELCTMINGVSRRKRKPFKSTHRLENYLEWRLSSSIQNKRHFRERLHISSVRPSKWLRSDANCVYPSSWRWYSKSLKSMSFTRLQQKTKVTVVSIPNNERQPLPLCLLEMESLHLSSYQDFRWLYMFHLGEMVCLLNKFIRCTGWWRNV